MLKDFFHLNDEAKAHVISDAAAFDAMFINCNDLINAAAISIDFPKHTRTFKDKRFKNINFSKSYFIETTMTECQFEDCIFVGCEFDEVEFHRCRFINCNFYKTNLFDVYLDPRSIYFYRGLRRNYSNVILGFYQELYANLENARQWKFSMYADIKRRQWDRYQIAYRIRNWKAANGREFLGSVWDQLLQIRSYTTSLFYGATAKYGYGPLRFLMLSLLSVLSVSYYVKENWSSFGFDANLGAGDMPQSLFYVSTVASTLGYSRYVPTTDFGLFFSSALGLVGVAWTGVLIAILIRRFVR